MNQPVPNLENLIAELELCEQEFNRADKLEPTPQQRFSLKEINITMQQSMNARYYRGLAQERYGKLSEIPGFERIQIYCEAEFGERVTLQIARRIRGTICRAGKTLAEANSMTLHEVADALSRPQADTLPEREQNILEALGDKTLVADEIAPLAGYECNSRFRQTLSDMVKANKLIKVKRLGYRRA